MKTVDSWTVHLDSGLAVSVPPKLSSMTTYVLLEQQRWFEPEMSLLPHLLRPGMNALDIGANHGLYAMAMAQCVAGAGAGAAAGHVWAFEPTLAPRTRLQRSLAANGLQHRVTVVPAALAEADGEASFAVHDNSELNSRDGAGTERETVLLRTLDGVLAQQAPERQFAFVKLDAEGDELRVLAGASAFFARQSPVVMFEFMHGKVVASALLDAWHALGYALFRWSAELQLLLPFDAGRDELVFALNLLAVRPAQQQELAAQGLLVTRQALADAVPPDALALAPQSLQAWCERPALHGFDAARAADAGELYERGLRAVAAAHGDASLAPARRLALLCRLRDEIQAAADAGATLGVLTWALQVHLLQALCAQHASVSLAFNLLARWPAGGEFELPFVPPQRADLERTRSSTGASWLRQMLAEHVERHTAHSSYFGPPSLERLVPLLLHPDHGAEIERRWLLGHALQNRSAPLRELRLLPQPRHTCNAPLWSGLMQSMREPACGAPAVPVG